jgi:hypothetical protein
MNSPNPLARSRTYKDKNQKICHNGVASLRWMQCCKAQDISLNLSLLRGWLEYACLASFQASKDMSVAMQQ